MEQPSGLLRLHTQGDEGARGAGNHRIRTVSIACETGLDAATCYSQNRLHKTVKPVFY